MPPKAPKGGDSLGEWLLFSTLYAISAMGMVKLLETGEKKESKEEPKKSEPNWLQRNFPTKPPGYYKKQVEEQMLEERRKEREKLMLEREQSPQPAQEFDTSILKLTEQDRLQAENMLKP